MEVLISKEDMKQRALLGISRLPMLTENRDWKFLDQMIFLIRVSYQITDDEKARGLLKVGLMNGIIEQENKLYRIKPLPTEDIESKYPKGYKS